MQPRQLVIESLREIGRTDFAKFALIQAMFAVAGMWMAIFVLELEQAPAHSFFILGLAELMGVVLLWLLTTRHKNRQLLWYSMLIVTVACWLFLSAMVAVTQSGWPVSLLLICVMALLATLKRSIIADTLAQVQVGTTRHLKLALTFFLVPLLTMGLSVGVGFASQIGLWLAFLLLAGMLGTAALRWRGHVPLQNTGQFFMHARPGRIAPRSRIQLVMGALINLVDAPLRFVMMPVYIYSYFDGDLGKVGTALGLLSLLVLIGSIIRYSLQQKRDLPVAVIKFTSVLIFAGIAVVWGWLYHMSAIILVLFALRAMMAPIWTFGFYATLQHYDEKNFHMNTHIYALMINTVHALGFLAIAPIGAMAFEYPQYYVLIAGSLETAIVLIGLVLWRLAAKQAPEKTGDSLY